MNPAAQRAKYKNMRQVLELLIRQGETSRISIANTLQLSTATVTNLVSELIKMGLVVESRLENTVIGRKATLLKFNEQAGKIFCIEICLNDALVLSLCDLNGNVYQQTKTLLPMTVTDERPIATIRYEIIRVITEFWNRLPKEELADVAAAAVSVCGLVDNRSIVSVPFYGWKDLDLGRPLQNALHIPVFIDNVTRMRAVYELRYIDLDEKNVVFLNLASGIGMVNFFDGKIVRGRTGISGEAGHMSLDADGPVCYCGNRGCFELYCGYVSILKQAQQLVAESGPDDPLYQLTVLKNQPVTFDVLAEAYELGSIRVQGLFAQVSRYLGVGIANLFNIYDPDRIIISGYHAHCDDYILRAAEAEARSRIVNKFERTIHLTVSKLSESQLCRAMTAYVLSCTLNQIIEEGSVLKIHP